MRARRNAGITVIEEVEKEEEKNLLAAQRPVSCYRLLSAFPSNPKKQCVEDFLPYEIPTQNYSLVGHEVLKKHLVAVCHPPEQLVRAFVYQHTRYVSWPEFLSKFLNSIDILVKLIGTRRWVAITTDADGYFAPEKSSFWLFRIAYTYLRQRYPHLVELKRLLRVITVGKADPKIVDAYHLYFDDPQPGSVVYVKLDDMSYSGEQMASSAAKLAEDNKIKQSNTPITIALVAPFMTKPALDLIQQTIRKTEKDRQPNEQQLEFVVEPFVQEWVPALESFLTPKMRSDKKFMAALGDGRRPAIYFAHKVPDIVSGYPHIYLGNIPANLAIVHQCPQRAYPRVIPLIRNCEQTIAENAANKYSKLSNELSPICPPPPYKSPVQLIAGHQPLTNSRQYAAVAFL